MYSKIVPYKDFKGNPRNDKLELHLSESDVMDNLVLLGRLFKWLEKVEGGPARTLDGSSEEMQTFFRDLKEVILTAYGETSEDGKRFSRSGRFDFEESALFNATIMMFITDIPEATKMLNGLVPEGFAELAKQQSESLEKAKQDPNITDEAKARIEALEKELAAARGEQPAAAAS